MGDLRGAGFLRFQIGTLENESSDGRGLHRKYLPYAFTEQGVAMLAGVLRSDTAVKTSIQIINAFVAMRRFISANAQVFQRLDKFERKQLETDENFRKIFNAIEARDIIPKQGIFFNGQVFDAYRFVSDLFPTARKSIVIIDNATARTIPLRQHIGAAANFCCRDDGRKPYSPCAAIQ